jgi:hypothetical protein
MKRRDFVTELEAQLPQERVRRARREAQKEILRLRLADVRKQLGVRQKEIRTFSQSGISKLESRRDMKLSTLVTYLNAMGMGVEIKAYPKAKGRSSKRRSVVLLKQ